MQLLEYTMGGMLEKWAFETPDKDFMVYPDRDLRFTYKQFDDRVNQLAKGLLFIGVKQGDKVGVWGKNVPDWLTILFATAKVGAVLVTVNTNYKTSELDFLFKNSDMHTLFIVDGFRDSNYVDMMNELVPELKTQPRGKLNSENFPMLKNVCFYRAAEIQRNVQYRRTNSFG